MASRTTTDPIDILLEMGVDLDNLSEEEDYLSALMEAANTLTIKDATDPRIAPLQQEILKLRKKRFNKARPEAKKTTIKPDAFFNKKSEEVKNDVKSGAIDSKKLKFSSVNIAPKQKALPTSAIVPYEEPVAEEVKEKKKEEPRNLLAEIAASVTNIADTLKNQYNLKKKEGEFDRKKAQRDKRKLDEKNLEKGFGTLLKSAQKIIKPVQGFFDKIFNFIKQILIGKFLIGLVNWISKPENQKKLFNIIDFLGKHWKKLLSLYLVFGTGLGRFVFGLTKLLISGAIKLGAAIAKLLAVKGLKRFAGVARFLGGSKGKLIATGAATALTVGGTMMGLGSLGFSGGGEVPQVQGYAGGGTVEPSPTKEDGPLNFIMNMSGAAKGAALGSLLGPLGTLAGAGIGSLFDKGKKKDDSIKLSKPAKVELEVPSEPSGTEGQVDGPGGTDKVPAMLTAGEFVMSRGAVQKYGVKTLESMNAAGGGTNQPKIVNNKVYASVGGYVGNAELGKKGTPDPEKEEKQPGSGGNQNAAGNAGGSGGGENPSTGDGSKTGGLPVVSVSHPNTGSGFGVEGVTDYKGRPGVFSKGAAEAFAKMITDSGGAVKGSDIASSQRSRSYNTKVGGVSNSNHLYGNALDIHGTSQTWMRANGRKYGWIVNDYPGSHGGHFNYKGAGASKMNTPDEGSPVATGQGGQPLGSTTQRAGTGLRSGGPSGPGESSVVLALKNGVQGKLNTATGKFTPKAFTEAEGSRYTQFGGKIPEKPKKPERSDFSMGRSGAKKYQEAKKSFEAAAATSKVTPKATTKTLTKEQLLGKSGVMPTTDQLSATATKRHAELMKSTDQKRIADYDAKHGEGAYSKRLKEKLNKTYSPEKAKQITTGKVKPTGKVVGRENLSPQAQAAIARLEAKKGLPPDMQYTRNGKKISAEEFNRVKSGNIMPGDGKPGGFLGGMMEGAKNMLGGMFGGMGKPPAPAPGQKVIDGNIGKATAEEQKAIDRLNANRARADKREAESKAMMNRPKKSVKDDPLFAEYQKAYDDPKHPLHDKVAGDLFDDTGTKDPMRFEDFKKLKTQQAQVKPPAKVAPTPPKVSAPEPPQKPAISVVKAPSKKQQGGQRAAPKGGSRTPEFNAGSGSSSKRKILGIF